MQHDVKAFLYDIVQASRALEDFTQDLSFEAYKETPLVKAAVERKFIVIGESLMRLREYSEWSDKISDSQKIIGFRNILVHGYDAIDDATVWSAIRENLPVLHREAKRLVEN